MNAKPVVTVGFYQACPVCNGAGLVSRPDFIAGDITQWSDCQTGGYPCRVCSGLGLIQRPALLASYCTPTIKL